MTSYTLPRATVEQALEALESVYGDSCDALHALRAALAQEPTPPPEARTEAEKTAYAAGWWDALRKAQQAEPVQEPITRLFGTLPVHDAQQAEPVEPVAWRWGYRSVTTGEMDWRGYVEIAAHPNLRSPEIIMEPLYAAPPQRKPLPKQDQHCVDVPGYGLIAVRLVRAVERAHGIEEKK